jgi:hypothetical protein
MGFNFFRSILKGNTAAGIHLNIGPSGTWSFDVIMLKREKNLIKIRNTYSKTLGFDELVKQIPSNVPIVLSVDGKGIIHRQLSTADITLPVLQILPNVKPGDFWVQLRDIDNESHWVSIMRLDTIKEIMDFFTTKGYFVYKISLGPFSMNSLWSLLDSHTEEYIIDSYKFKILNGLITQIELVIPPSQGQPYSVGNEKIDSSLLIPYTNALSFFTGDLEIAGFSEDISRESREEFHYKRVFRATAGILLVLLFCILMINFILFDSYNRSYIQSNLQYKSGLELVDRLNNLKKELTLKEVLIQENGLLSGSKFSFFADKIASFIPQQIVLSRLSINPVTAKLKPDKELLIDRNCISVAGECLSSFYLDSWIGRLRKETWIKRIDILQYNQENKETPGKFIIRIEI